MARRLVPSDVNVGFLQLATLMFCVTAPGMRAICVKLARTRLIGIGAVVARSALLIVGRPGTTCRLDHMPGCERALCRSPWHQAQ